jgi:hypothetical protein
MASSARCTRSSYLYRAAPGSGTIVRMNDTLKRTIIAMATAALGFTASGCGDDEETEATESPATTEGGEEMSCGEAGCTGHDHDEGGGDTATDPAGEGEASCGEGSCG